MTDSIFARVIFSGVSSLSLIGCDRTAKENGWVCSELPSLEFGELLALNPQERLTRCLIKWGYRLSHSPDPARNVTNETLVVCK